MKYALQYLKTAGRFFEGYDGSLPLYHFLKNKFATEKKYGSKDRKYISHLCYSYFRLGHFLKDSGADERIKVAVFLSGNEEWKDLFSRDWLENFYFSIEKRIRFIERQYGLNILTIFPWQNELSTTIETDSFSISHLNQPDLFIRIRPGKEETVKTKLAKAGIPVTRIQPGCFALENGTKLEDVLEINKEYVVQDVNSQKTGELLSYANYRPSPKVWDCCAASGGKSIMAYDIIANIQLTVSDIRPSIIHNLKARFAQGDVKNYISFVADLTQPTSNIPNSPFDLVICDAPCSGSGTWSRSPEQLYFFKEEEIARYSNLQKKIASNAIQFIQPGGHLLYITCSVFKKENEEVVEYIKKQFQLTLIKMELLKGYDKKADTLFAALFLKDKTMF